MRHFPVFLNVADKRIVVAGAEETAVAKLRLLLKTEAEIHVYGEAVHPQVESWAEANLLTLHRRAISQRDFYNTALCYAAEDDADRDACTDTMARMAGVLSNIVDNLQDSEFITPALVDRDPVVVAIGTEGTAPVLARHIKANIEESLPGELGLLARLANRFRSKAAGLPGGRTRRGFWSSFFFDRGPQALKAGGPSAVSETLDALYDETLATTKETGKVFFVGAGPGDPDLLTRKALRLLHEADVIIHDRLIAREVLELARREATFIETGKQGFGPSWKQEDINALMVEKATGGQQVIRLKSGDPSVFGRLDEEMDALDAANIRFEVVAGITTASAVAANLSASLTKRNRNSSLQILTAKDVKGFADQDWRNLSKSGAVAAIYMGMKSAHYLSGRLLMHGADKDAPITIVENVSRPNQRVIPATVYQLPKIAETETFDGPVILMLGLEPRKTKSVIATPTVENDIQAVLEAGAL